MPPKIVRAFQRSLLRWYSRNGRDLPWRRTRDPYAVLISEFMLQQTQVATVLPYYNKWLRRFPDFSALAQACESQIMHAWQGLGYYRRARNLYRTAKIVRERHGGILPQDISEIRALPGIGSYTANAVASFAFDQAVPVVETNIARVIARLFDERQPIDSVAGKQRLWQQASELLPPSNCADHNSALMDLGALICTARKPKCGMCPVKKFCRATTPERLPFKRARPQTKRLVEAHALIIRRDKILLQKSTKRWRGMWILPPHKLDRFRRSSLPGSISYTLVFPFTYHRVTLHVFHQRPRRINNKRERWFRIGSLSSIPLPSPHRRAISAILH